MSINNIKVSVFFVLFIMLIGGWQTTNAMSVSDDSNDSNDGSEVKLTGKIEKLPNTMGQIGDWQVAGSLIHVSNNTKVESQAMPITVGQVAEIEGQKLSDNSINAKEIKVKTTNGSGGSDDDGQNGYFKFYGKIENLPNTTGQIGDWQIAGKLVTVTSATKIETETNIEIGKFTEVEGKQQPNQSILATKIEVKQAEDRQEGSQYSEFLGKIESLPSTVDLVGDWQINGMIIKVTSQTSIDQHEGKAVVGVLVEVKGFQQNNIITASEIEVKSSVSKDSSFTKIYGLIENLPPNGLLGQWQVNGQQINVSASTYIDTKYGKPVIGAYVEVEGIKQTGSFNVTKVEIREKTNQANKTIFYGIVETLPNQANLLGIWQVSGRLVEINSATKVSQKDPIKIGSRVKITATTQNNNTILASSVKMQK